MWFIAFKGAFHLASIAVLVSLLFLLLDYRKTITLDEDIVFAVLGFIALGLAVLKIKDFKILALATWVCFSTPFITSPGSAWITVRVLGINLLAILLAIGFGCLGIHWKRTSRRTSTLPTGENKIV